MQSAHALRGNPWSDSEINLLRHRANIVVADYAHGAAIGFKRLATGRIPV
jgi:hypothetical protein